MRKISINANVLKIFAIATMLIDHYATYFVSVIEPTPYYIMRSIGRLAMPIFLYLIVQGFFYTKDLKKYIFRIFCLATITQLILLLLGILNNTYFNNYVCSENEYLGVLFSYALSLILIAAMECKNPIKKLNKYLNLAIRVIIIILIFIIYINVKIEFDMRVPFMCLELYIIEKIFMDKENKKLLLKRDFDSKAKYAALKLLYVLLIEMSFVSSLNFSSYHPGYKYAIIYTAIPLLLYSGEKGKRNKAVQSLFYIVFPVQHLLFYMSAMILT